MNKYLYSPLYFIVTILIGVLAGKLIQRYWPATGKYGIPKTIKPCPSCGASPVLFRKPANRRQLIWGGWTCSKCGLELDRYGEPIKLDKNEPTSQP